jgi:hypothetical protein
MGEASVLRRWWRCDSVRPKELFAKYGRPPLGDNIPPFADTVNVTAVLI